MNKGFKAKGTSLAEAYHDASIALRFLRNCSSDRPSRTAWRKARPTPRPSPARTTTCSTSAPPTRVTGRQIANDFALNWVGLPTVSGLDLSVTHQGGTGILEVSIACRTGNAVTVTSVGTRHPRRSRSRR